MCNLVGLRLGLTMRVVETLEYFEPRDALSQEWPRFMKDVLPEARWIPVPNVERDVVKFADGWSLNGFIITGGNDLYSCPSRDETERILLDYALNKHLPVFGVCRGLQIMAHYFGHKISACSATAHVATNHPVHLIGSPFGWKETSIMVNSYHGYCIGDSELFTAPFIPFAVGTDGLVEGARHQNHKLLGTMWHPERDNPADSFELVGQP